MTTASSQGHGIKDRFLGLSDSYSTLESSQYVILPIPFDMTTTFQQGTNFGPSTLIEASRNLELYDTETETQPYLLGIHTASPVKADSSREMLDKTYNTALSFLKMGKFVVGLGGEHSITPALIRAHAAYHGSLSILQFDAQADLIMTYEGDPLNHACAMARVKEIPSVSHIVSVGIRSMSFEESEMLDRPNTFFAHKLHDNDAWMDQVVNNLSEKVYITFDLDAFDSSIMPSTGTPEPGGLSWNQATTLLRKVAEKKQIVGFDIMELCPIDGLKAPDFLAAKLVYKLLSFKEKYEH